jgi:hypothetical protein
MEDWRAGYLETGTSGSEGSSVKPDMATCQGARFLPYGLVDGLELELGYFSLKELQSIKGPMALPVERDLYYEPKSLRELMEWQNNRDKD